MDLRAKIPLAGALSLTGAALGCDFDPDRPPIDVSDAELRRATEAFCGLIDACFVPRLPVDYCIRDYVDLLTYEAPDCRLEAVEYFDCVATLYCEELEYDAYVGLPSCPAYANAFDRCLERSVRR